jgi:hypothetical protein
MLSTLFVLVLLEGLVFFPGQHGPSSSYFRLLAIAGMTGACHHANLLVEIGS